MSRATISRLADAACACVVIAVVVERVRAIAAAPPTDFDDAYMFVRYANNLIAGHGLAWNPGEPAYGVTGLAHLLAVAALRFARPAWSDARVLVTASAGAALAALAVLSLACARFASHPWLRGHRWRCAALVVPLAAYSEPFWFHATRGMDTMSSLLANAALIFAVLRLAERPTRAAAAWCALASWAAFFARPDDAVYALACPLLAIALLCPPPRRALVLAFAPLAAALVAAHLLAARHFLGTALPLALYAKRPHAYGGFVGEYTWNPFLFLEVFFRGAAPFAIALVLCAGRRHARALVVLLAPVALTFAGFFAVNQIMGHLGRFYFPSLAFFVVAAALAADEPAFARAPARLGARVAIALAAIVGGGAALEAAGARYERRAESQPLASLGGYHIAAAHPLPELDSWRSSLEIARIAAAAPPGTRFAMSEHGVVGARAPGAVIIDLVGLHDRAFALGGFSARELFRRPLDADEFWTRYDFYPDVFTYGLALRKDGPRAAAVRALVEKSFGENYP